MCRALSDYVTILEEQKSMEASQINGRQRTNSAKSSRPVHLHLIAGSEVHLCSHTNFPTLVFTGHLMHHHLIESPDSKSVS
jgi:hypothetical protein